MSQFPYFCVPCRMPDSMKNKMFFVVNEVCLQNSYSQTHTHKVCSYRSLRINTKLNPNKVTFTFAANKNIQKAIPNRTFKHMSAMSLNSQHFPTIFMNTNTDTVYIFICFLMSFHLKYFPLFVKGYC